jgi:hypothetical protein
VSDGGGLIDDPDVAAFVDAHWRAAMASARQTMEALRLLTPELDAHLPEKAAVHIRHALREVETAYGDLHHAGGIVLGEDDYNSYLAAQTARRIG